MYLIMFYVQYFLGRHSGLEEELDRDVVYYRCQALSVATKKSYNTQLRSYLSFCKIMGYYSVTITTPNLLRYTAFLAKRLAPQSIPAYLNVIRLLHLENNFPNPLQENFVLDSLVKGIKRDKTIIIRQALPITPEILLLVRSALDLSSPFWAYFWAACTVAFFSFLRKSNLFFACHTKHYIKRNYIIVDDCGQT